MENESVPVRLVKVDTRNIDALIELEPTEQQKSYVADNISSLAEAYAVNAEGRFAQPFGIYAGDTPVGFIMVGYDYMDPDPDEELPDYVHGSYLLWRMMIDKAHQNKGYGRAAMKLFVDYIRTFPAGEAEYCWVSYDPENETARHLYQSFGFVEMPKPEDWGEVPALLKLQ